MEQILGAPLAVLHCPSRRVAARYPFTGERSLRNANAPEFAAKRDYAISGGSMPFSPGCDPENISPEGVRGCHWPSLDGFAGVSAPRSQVVPADIEEIGLNNIVFVGEKHMDANHNEAGLSPGDVPRRLRRHSPLYVYASSAGCLRRRRHGIWKRPQRRPSVPLRRRRREGDCIRLANSP